MTETVDEHGAETSAGQQPGLPGRDLRRAREAAGLGLGDVARQLHLTEDTIQCLEADEYDRLAGATYVGGYLRAYARTLGLDEDAILSGYLQSTQVAPELMPEGTIQPGRRAGFGAGVLIFAAVVVLGVPAGWWWYQSGAAPGTSEDPVPAPAESSAMNPEPASKPVSSAEILVVSKPDAADSAMQTEPVAVSQPQADATSEPQTADAGPRLTEESPDVAEGSAADAPLSPTLTDATESALSPTPAIATNPTSTASGVSAALEMVYHNDSWTEVRDARGTALVYRMVTAGSLLELSGVPPFTVVLGYAPGVSITYNGRPFDLTGFTRNDIARATVGAAPQTEAQ